jgi:demethylmenaquinone methyltransferase/2-methoxy-6-polyprenyl-1,4-benzoquinol methylase
MRQARQVYYDGFSVIYDRFVAMHSGDGQRSAREFLAGLMPVSRSGAVLDLCTGTGTLVPYLADKVGPSGRVAALDFSKGMLRQGRRKAMERRNVLRVQGDAGSLPFAPASFGAVTCSHAFYELKGETREHALQEIGRVLAPGGVFFMMEHDLPEGPLIRLLFYLRLAVAGAGRVRGFLRQERALLERHFSSVEKVLSPTGRSKVMRCRK